MKAFWLGVPGLFFHSHTHRWPSKRMACNCTFQDYSTVQNYCPGSSNVTVFMQLVDLMIRSNCRIADPCRRVQPPRRDLKDENFDFIIVGGGVAGSVMAGRLSENPNWRVLLLEAGPEEPTTTGVPAWSTSGIGTKVDWGYKTQPQKQACLSTGGVCKWPRGKMLGGTGSLTGMMYMRGHRKIYDDWAQKGNVGWSYQDVLPFFIKSEKNKNPELVDKNYHGFNGPLVVQNFPYQPEMIADLLAAGRELGYRTGDLNGANQTGMMVAQAMVDGGVRCSTSRAYLRPSLGRKNLVVKIESQATKILIDPHTKRAFGVEYVDKAKNKYKALANKEVILSSGAIGSPQLLLLSGVGPAKDLKRHKIPVIMDLPVGQNLHNHVSVGFPILIKGNNRREMTMAAIRQYLDKGQGPLASTGLTQIAAFLTSKYSRNGVADLQVFFDGFSAGCSGSGKVEECNDGSLEENCGEREITARPTLVLAKSTGYLTLKSADPFDPPLLYPNYLSEQQDVDILIDGIDQMLKLIKTKAMKKWGARIKPEIKPKCAHLEFRSDQYWECVIRSYTGPENHPAGSCSMGPSKNDSVVDPELRVHGIPNLRVVDASIFPYVPNSNPIASIVMAAEKCAFMVKSSWGQA